MAKRSPISATAEHLLCHENLYFTINGSITMRKRKTTRAEDVLPNINCTQAAKINPGSDGMVPSAAAE